MGSLVQSRRVAWGVGLAALAVALSSCGGVQAVSMKVADPPDPITSVTPSATGTPNSVTAFGGYVFVSVQGTGQIFSYNLESGAEAAVYLTPCSDPSGMEVTTIAGANVMAAVCYDTGALLTLVVNADGSLHALGRLMGLPSPYPGIALDGTDVFVPLFGSSSANGGVMKISIANPSSPVLTGTVTLASPAPGDVANASWLAVAGGYVFVAAGSESAPQSSSSSIQMLNEATMTLVGSPLAVAHSPQQIAIAGTVAYVSFYDATELETIDISNSASVQALEVVPLTGCHAEPVIVNSGVAYVGCYAEGRIARLNVSNPASVQAMAPIAGIVAPERMTATQGLLVVTDASTGGAVYTIDLGGL